MNPALRPRRCRSCQGRPVSRVEGRSRSKMPRPPMAPASPPSHPCSFPSPSPCRPTKAAPVVGDGSPKRHGLVLWWGAPHLPILTRPEALASPVLKPLCAKCWRRANPRTRLPALPGLMPSLTRDVAVCGAWSRPRRALMHRGGPTWGRGSRGGRAHVGEGLTWERGSRGGGAHVEGGDRGQ